MSQLQNPFLNDEGDRGVARPDSAHEKDDGDLAALDGGVDVVTLGVKRQGLRGRGAPSIALRIIDNRGCVLGSQTQMTSATVLDCGAPPPWLDFKNLYT